MAETVAFIYGFAEGPAHLKRAKPVFEKAGYTILKDPAKADYIIAHSYGAYVIPKKLQAKRVILVGPSAGFQKTVLHAMLFKVIKDIISAFKTRELFFLYKTFWNIRYMIRQLPSILHIRRLAYLYKQKLPEVTTNVTVILYKDDPWSWWFPESEKKKFPHYTYVTRKEVHDDLWSNPQDYLSYLN